MAFTVHSYVNNTSINTNNVGVTNPSGLTAGDLLVSQFCFNVSGSTITMPSGWTEIVRTDRTNKSVQIAYKVASSTDVSNNSYGFSHNGGNTSNSLTIIRISGHNNSQVVLASSGQSNSASTTTTAPTVTPTIANSLILFFVENAGGTVSGYSLATSSPSFTELYDIAFGSNTSMAYGVRPETTATGAGTATNSSSLANIGQLVVIGPPQSISNLDNMTITETKTVNMSALVQDMVSMTESTLNSISRVWTNVIKTTKTWVNRIKD